MDTIIGKLLSFGLTRQEATLYLTLLENGGLTGYEAAKLTGISRSNSYSALAGLAEKGAAYLMEENVSKYTAVPFREFAGNFVRRLQGLEEEIIPLLPRRKTQSDGYLTIRGTAHIMDKLINMIRETEYRLYLSVPPDILQEIKEDLQRLVDEGRQVVILTSVPYTLEGAVTYLTGKKDSQIRLIADSTKVLTGRILPGEDSTCLYSLNRNLVDVFKDMLQNEIRLIELNQEVKRSS